MQSAKETASNVGATAKAGMEKTKAAMQEKAERMTTRDPLQKEMATDKKDLRVHEAERQKHEARMHNAAAARPAGQESTTAPTTGSGLHSATAGTGLHQTRAGATGTTGAYPEEDPNIIGGGVRGARGGYGTTDT